MTRSGSLMSLDSPAKTVKVLLTVQIHPYDSGHTNFISRSFRFTIYTEFAWLGSLLNSIRQEIPSCEPSVLVVFGVFFAWLDISRISNSPSSVDMTISSSLLIGLGSSNLMLHRIRMIIVVYFCVQEKRCALPPKNWTVLSVSLAN